MYEDHVGLWVSGMVVITVERRCLEVQQRVRKVRHVDVSLNRVERYVRDALDRVCLRAMVDHEHLMTHRIDSPLITLVDDIN